MRNLAAIVFATVLSLAGAAGAGELYLAGNLAISVGHGDSGGSTLFFTNGGSDDDSSPALGGALGYAFALDEAIPRLQELDFPDLGIRVEVEATGLRDYELKTRASAISPYFTEVESWSVMNNLWIDAPLKQPISRLFGRIPVLEPLSFYAGAGLGLATTEVSTTDTASSGKDTKYNFAYQAGAGLGYALSEHVTFSLGYRYQDLGDANVPLFDASGPFGNYKLDMEAHEFTTSLRVEFWSLPFPSW